MELGVDFGTTRIVVAAADRGNYPLAGFETPDGQIREWFPPLVAVCGQTRLFGWQAAAVQANREWNCWWNYWSRCGKACAAPPP
jgi:molecular chaperone DnaK (HSP70)